MYVYNFLLKTVRVLPEMLRKRFKQVDFVTLNSCKLVLSNGTETFKIYFFETFHFVVKTSQLPEEMLEKGYKGK